ncbi:hypothetical protein RCL1_007542 [Eukaryota sp. TZLM3-RCL]
MWVPSYWKPSQWVPPHILPFPIPSSLMFDQERNGVLHLKELERVFQCLALCIPYSLILESISNPSVLNKHDGFTWTDFNDLLTKDTKFHSFLGTVNSHTFRYNISCILSCVLHLSSQRLSYNDLSILRQGFDVNASESGLPANNDTILHSLRLANRIISTVRINDFIEQLNKNRTENLTLFEFFDLSSESYTIPEVKQKFSKNLKENRENLGTNFSVKTEFQKLIELLNHEYYSIKNLQKSRDQELKNQNKRAQSAEVFDFQSELINRRLFSNHQLHKQISELKQHQSIQLRNARAGIIPKNLSNLIEDQNETSPSVGSLTAFGEGSESDVDERAHQSRDHDNFLKSQTLTDLQISKKKQTNPIPTAFQFPSPRVTATSSSPDTSSLAGKEQWLNEIDKTLTARSKAKKRQFLHDSKVRSALLRDANKQKRAQNGLNSTLHLSLEPCKEAAKRNKVRSKNKEISSPVIPGLDFSTLPRQQTRKQMMTSSRLIDDVAFAVKEVEENMVVSSRCTSRIKQDFFSNFPLNICGKTVSVNTEKPKLSITIDPPSPTFTHQGPYTSRGYTSRPSTRDKYQKEVLMRCKSEGSSARSLRSVDDYKKEFNLYSGIDLLRPSTASFRLTSRLIS